MARSWQGKSGAKLKQILPIGGSPGCASPASPSWHSFRVSGCPWHESLLPYLALQGSPRSACCKPGVFKEGLGLCFIHLTVSRVFFFCLFVFLSFLGPLLWHMEVPGLGVESELQLPAYTTAIATQDPSHVCDLCHSSRQCRILNPQSKARDQTRNLMVPSRIC